VNEPVHVVCMKCGTRWIAFGRPHACSNLECEAGWLDLPEYADKAAADQAAARRAKEMSQ
jgi:hypothetical protein